MVFFWFFFYDWLAVTCSANSLFVPCLPVYCHCLRVKQLILAAGSSITLLLVCQLIQRNPQSDFDSGIVLLMHACFYHPGGGGGRGGKRRFEVYEQILLLLGGWHTGLFCMIQLEKDTMMKRCGGMLMSAGLDTSKDP